jgi:uncharacterized membrane protein YtjA (UPF0391 family)
LLSCAPEKGKALSFTAYSLKWIHKHLNPAYSWGVELRIESQEDAMLGWAVTFLVIALVAAVLGFGGVAFAAAGIAKLLFVIFLVLFLVSLITHMGRRRSV